MRPSEWPSVTAARWRGGASVSATAARRRAHPLARQRRDRVDQRAAGGHGGQRGRRLALQKVRLVPDLEHGRGFGHAEIAQDRHDLGGLVLGLGVADVAHVQDQVGVQHLFQRGAEGGDQLGRKDR